MQLRARFLAERTDMHARSPLGTVVAERFATMLTSPFVTVSRRRIDAPLAHVAAALALVATIGCGGTTTPADSTNPTHASDAGDAAPETSDLCSGLGLGLPSPVGKACTQEGGRCTYGYEVACGEQTFECQSGRFVDVTDRTGCDAGTDAAPSETLDVTDAVVGGPCAYEDVPGLAKITSIESTPASGITCKTDPVMVSFTFQAATGTGLSMGGAIAIQVGSKDMLPPRSCLAGEGITVGASLPGTMHRITKGTCMPASFTFTSTFPSCVADCSK
jgi:hypothetical protein